MLNYIQIVVYFPLCYFEAIFIKYTFIIDLYGR